MAIGYGAGLATGLSRFPDPAFVAGVLLLVAVVLRRDPVWPLLAAASAGCVVGRAARHSADGSCAARLAAGERQLTVRAIDPGWGTGRVLVMDRQCRGMLTARWSLRGVGVTPAGTVAHVTGRWLPGVGTLSQPQGTLTIESMQRVQVDPTMAERMRNAIVDRARRLFGGQAALAVAAITGWRGALDQDVKDAFANAGLMHLLTVSGLHVAWLAAWVLLLLRFVRLGRHPAECLAATTALAYAALLGWPAAGTRAALLLLLLAYCRWRQRQVSIDAMLAASALALMVVQPWAIAGVGFWLSNCGVAGVAAAVRWSDRALGRAWWIRSITASAGAIIATAPLAAATFGAVAPIGLLLNLVALPLLSVLLPAIAVAIVLPPGASVLASGFASSAGVLIETLTALARAGATVPSLAPMVPGWRAAIPWIVVALGAGWIIQGRATLGEAARRGVRIATAWLVLSLLLPRAASDLGAHDLTLYFIDVGQGDAEVIRTPRGHWVEIDAGPDEAGFDAGRRVVAPWLIAHGARRVDLFVLSHAHRDHVGGGVGVLDRLPIDLAIEPGEIFADSAYTRWLAALAAQHVRWRAARRGAQWTIDGVTFQILHPPSPWPPEGEDLNEDSIVLLLTFGSFRALLMGDAGFVAESALVHDLVPVNLLKVGHHGSKTASSAAFLAAVQPQAAVVSVGRHNRYGHPAAETLARLAAAGAQVWRTDVDGTVTVATAGTGFSVKAARGVATFGPSR